MGEYVIALSPNWFPMNVISWNYRGTTVKGFGALIKDLKRYHVSKLVILMATRTGGVRAAGIIKKLVLTIVLFRRPLAILKVFGVYEINLFGRLMC